MVVGEHDGLGPYFGPVKFFGGGANGFFTAGQVDVHQHLLAGGAGVHKAYVYKVLDAQLGDAGGYSIHSKWQPAGGEEMPRLTTSPANRGRAPAEAGRSSEMGI